MGKRLSAVNLNRSHNFMPTFYNYDEIADKDGLIAILRENNRRLPTLNLHGWSSKSLSVLPMHWETLLARQPSGHTLPGVDLDGEVVNVPSVLSRGSGPVVEQPFPLQSDIPASEVPQVSFPLVNPSCWWIPPPGESLPPAESLPLVPAPQWLQWLLMVYHAPMHIM